MRRTLYAIVTLGLLALVTPTFAQPAASWSGLIGLFTQPTAESLPAGQVALTFSEIRFSQENSDLESEDIWYSGSATWAISPRWEVALTNRHEVDKLFVDTDVEPQRKIDSTYLIGDVKYIITPPRDNKIGLATGIMDLTDVTDKLGGMDVDRGRRLFLVGTYKWAHLGLTQDNDGFGAYAGATWGLTDNIDIVAEYVTKPTFVQLTPRPNNDVNFNLGARIYPRGVPNLRIDATAVGDGTFNFGFSFSYRFRP